MKVIKYEEWSDKSSQEVIKEVILALVQKDLSCYMCGEEGASLLVGEFDNCREYGYTYALSGAKQDIVFCVYEHRNSDQIIINGCLRKDVKSYGPYKEGNKYDVLAEFSYNQYTECAERLAEFLVWSYRGEFNESSFLAKEYRTWV